MGEKKNTNLMRFQTFIQENHFRRQTTAVAFILSMLVLITVTLSMTKMADATNISPNCGYQEHTHTASCYYRKLICNHHEPEHSHDEDCFEYVLICGNHAHRHNAACFETEGTGHFLSLIQLFSPITVTTPERVSVGEFENVVNTIISENRPQKETVYIEPHLAKPDPKVLEEFVKIDHPEIIEQEVPQHTGLESNAAAEPAGQENIGGNHEPVHTESPVQELRPSEITQIINAGPEQNVTDNSIRPSVQEEVILDIPQGVTEEISSPAQETQDDDDLTEAVIYNEPVRIEYINVSPAVALPGQEVVFDYHVENAAALSYSILLNGQVAETDTLNPSSTSVTWTPETTGDFTFVLNASDKEGNQESASTGGLAYRTVTREDWLTRLKKLRLSGEWAEDTASVAESQIGYLAKDITGLVQNENGLLSTVRKDMFVSFVLNYAGIDEGLLNTYMTSGNAVQRGDILCVDYNKDGIVDHRAVVTGTEEDVIYVVEEASNGLISTGWYSVYDEAVYSRMDMWSYAYDYRPFDLSYSNEEYEVTVHAYHAAGLDEDTEIEVFTLEDEMPVNPEKHKVIKDQAYSVAFFDRDGRQITPSKEVAVDVVMNDSRYAVMYQNEETGTYRTADDFIFHAVQFEELFVLEETVGGMTATLKYTADAEIPETAELRIKESENAEEYLNAANELFENTVENASFYEIGIYDGETKVEPKSSVEITVSGCETANEDRELHALTMVDDNAVEVSCEDGTVSFETASAAAEPEEDGLTNAVQSDVEISESEFRNEEESQYAQQSSLAEGEILTEEIQQTFERTDTIIVGIVETSLQTTVMTADGEEYHIEVIYNRMAGIPDGSYLTAEEITQDHEGYEAYLKTVQEAVGTQQIEYARFFDISIFHEGVMIEPKNDVKVFITYAGHQENENEELRVLHFKEEQTTVIEAEKEGNEESETVSFSADSFSVFSVVYTVDFHWEVDGKEYTIILRGGGYLSFEALMEALNVAETTAISGFREENADTVQRKAETDGSLSLNDIEISEETKKFVADVDSVRFSNPDLVWVGKVSDETTVGSLKDANALEVQYSADLSEDEIEQINAQTVRAGDWAMISLLPFDSEENLIITMKNGTSFIIRVTDARDPMGLDGRTYAMVYRGSDFNLAVQANQTWEDIDGKRVTYYNDSGVEYCEETATAWHFEYHHSDGDAHYYYISAMGYHSSVQNQATNPSETDKHYFTIGWRDGENGNPGGYSPILVPDNLKTLVRVEKDNNGNYQISDGNGHYLDYNHSASWGGNNTFSALSAGGTDTYSYFRFCLPESHDGSHKATMISAADTQAGQKIVIYQRVIDPTNDTITYYAINGQGGLERVYYSSDSVYWSQDLNIEWTLNYLGNGYYTLYNEKEHTYLSPKYDNGSYHIVHQESDFTATASVPAKDNLSISLPGRDDGTYTSLISCWDYVDYATYGLKATGNRTSATLAVEPFMTSQEFYFAARDPIVHDQLTTVDTVDSASKGITIRMYDWGQPDGSDSRYQSNDPRQGGYYVQDRLEMMQEVMGAGSDTYAKRTLRQGLVSNRLDSQTGFPNATIGGRNLNGLFNDDYLVADNVNNLFLQSVYDETGFFKYSSMENFAYLPEGSNQFIVYEQIGTPSNRGAGNEGEWDMVFARGNFMPFNRINPAMNYRWNKYDSELQPLPTTDPRCNERLYYIENVGNNVRPGSSNPETSANYYFGMTMEAQFTQNPAGIADNGDPMVFEFHGDDDMWIFIDGVLVLDVGGDHDAFRGSVNFRTGVVKVYADGGSGTILKVNSNNQTTTVSGTTSIYEMFKASGVYPDGTSPAAGASYESKAADYFHYDSAQGKYTTFKDFTAHEFKMIYMERGASASNLELNFNLPIMEQTQFRVKKEMTETQSGEAIQSVYGDSPFYYAAYVKENGTFVPCSRAYLASKGLAMPVYEGEEDENGNPVPVQWNSNSNNEEVFLLRPGQTAVFPAIDDAVEWYTVEISPDENPEMLNNFVVSNTDQDNNMADDPKVDEYDTIYDHGAKSNEKTIKKREKVIYNNKPDDAFVNKLQITKEVIDGVPYNPTDSFEIRIFLEKKNGEMAAYRLGEYYQYENYGTPDQRFVFIHHGKRYTASGCTKQNDGTYLFTGVKDDNGTSVANVVRNMEGTEYTSQNGSLNNVRHNDTIVVKGLLMGTDFYVYERTSPSNMSEDDTLIVGKYVYDSATVEDAYTRNPITNAEGIAEYLLQTLYAEPDQDSLDRLLRQYNASQYEQDHSAAGTIIENKDAKILLRNKPKNIELSVEKEWPNGIPSDVSVTAQLKRYRSYTAAIPLENSRINVYKVGYLGNNENWDGNNNWTLTELTGVMASNTFAGDSYATVSWRYDQWYGSTWPKGTYYIGEVNGAPEVAQNLQNPVINVYLPAGETVNVYICDANVASAYPNNGVTNINLTGNFPVAGTTTTVEVEDQPDDAFNNNDANDGFPPITVTLSADNDWTYTFPEQPSAGINPTYNVPETYTYYVEEVPVPSGYLAFYDGKSDMPIAGSSDSETRVITNVEKTGIPVDKTWEDNIENDNTLVWTADFELESIEVLVSGEPYAGANTKYFRKVTDVAPLRIWKGCTEAERSFADLPTYRVYPNGSVYRIIYSVDETAYELNRGGTIVNQEIQGGTTISKWDEYTGLTPAEADFYAPSFEHDAGDADDDYYDSYYSNLPAGEEGIPKEEQPDFNHIVLKNVKSIEKVTDMLTGLTLKKNWAPGAFEQYKALTGNDDLMMADAYAIFQLRRFRSDHYYVLNGDSWEEDGLPTLPREDLAFTRQHHEYILNAANTPSAWSMVIDNLPKTAEITTDNRKTEIHYSYYFEEIDCYPSGFSSTFKDAQNHSVGSETDDIQIDTDNTTVTATNDLKNGALKVTKIPTINGVPIILNEAGIEDMAFFYSIDGVAGSFTEGEHHTVELSYYVSWGETPWGIAVDVPAGAVDYQYQLSEDAGFILRDLKPGQYTITETNTGRSNGQDNVMDFVSVTGGNGDADNTNRRITVTVSAGDEDAEESTAQAEFTNNKDFGILGIEKIVKVNPAFGDSVGTLIDGTYHFEVSGPREKAVQDRVTYQFSITIQDGKMLNARMNGAENDMRTFTPAGLNASITEPVFIQATGGESFGVIISGLEPGTYNAKELPATGVNPHEGGEVYLTSLVAYDRQKSGRWENTTFTDTARETQPFMQGTEIESINLAVSNAWEDDYNVWNIAEAKFTNELVPNTLTHCKSVLDVNDSDDESPFESNPDNTWSDSGDYDIGDSIPYRIVGYLPQKIYQTRESYYYRIDDVLQNQKYIDGTGHMYAFVKGPEDDTGAWYQVDEYFNVTWSNASGNEPSPQLPFTYNASPQLSNGGTADTNNYLQVTTDQDAGLKAIRRGYRTMWGDSDVHSHDQKAEPTVSSSLSAINPNYIQYLQFRYKAELLDSANIGAVGNANDAKIYYDVRQNMSSTTNPEWDRNRVFTNRIEAYKTDSQTDLPLTGANFQLYKRYVGYTVTDNDWYTGTYATRTLIDGNVCPETLTLVGKRTDFPAGVTGVRPVAKGTTLLTVEEDDPVYYVQVSRSGNDPHYVWNGIDDGEYRMIETQAPNEYVPLAAPIGITVTADHEMDDDDPELDADSPSVSWHAIDPVSFTADAGVISGTIPNYPMGALKLTKLLLVDGHPITTEEQKHLVNGDYIFTIDRVIDDVSATIKYVLIHVADGVASSYKIAETEEALAAAAEITGTTALITELAEGDYYITETDERNGLMLVDISRADDNTECLDLDNSRVAVHVTGGDHTAVNLDAQATFTNSFYEHHEADDITIDLVKVFDGLNSMAEIPDSFCVILSFTVDGDEYELTLHKLQNETIEVISGVHVTIAETPAGHSLNWHITGISKNAENFRIKEINYDQITGYSFESASLDGTDITETADVYHNLSATAPAAVLSDVTGDRRTSDSGQNLEFILREGDILLSKLTGAMGTMIISRTSLNALEREAIEKGTGWPTTGGFSKTKVTYFSYEEHPEGFIYGGKEVTFSEVNGELNVEFGHSASAQEYVYTVSYGGESSLNNATLVNTYSPNSIALELIKVDASDMNKTLENAEFMLKKLDPDGRGTYLSGDDAVIKLSNATGSDGKALIEQITDGYYEISETSVPHGYVLLDAGRFYIKVEHGTVIRITPSEDNLNTELDESLVRNWGEVVGNTDGIHYVGVQPAVSDDPATTDIDESSPAKTTYRVCNTPGAALPETGGRGIFGYLITGGLLALVAGWLLIRRH